MARQLLGEEVREAKVLLYGSFLATGKGHGTDKALVAGLLGMKPDDYRIPSSIDIAEDKGMKLSFGEAVLKEAHPEYGTALFKRCFRQDAGAYRTDHLVADGSILQRLMESRRISQERIQH